MAPDASLLQHADPRVRSYIQDLEHSEQQWRVKHQALEARYDHLSEEYRLLLYKRFARSSERESADETQAFLFGEAEAVADESEQPSTEHSVTVAAHQRIKRGRKPLAEHLPRVEILHDIDEADKQCACGCTLTRIGEETSERLQVIPEQIYVERHIRAKYACKACEGSGDEEKPAVRIASSEPALIPGSIVTPGLLAFVLVNKFVDHLPFYRQEARFGRLGIAISRADMSNWTIGAAAKLAPLIDLFEQQIRGGPLIQMDETTVQVLDEPGRANTSKSYMWLARGGPPQAPVLLYRYQPTRGSGYPSRFLADYQGFVQSDGYEVYDRVCAAEPGIVHVGCWAHARRKFHEAAKAGKKSGSAAQALAYISKLYQIEKSLRATCGDDPETFARQRREQVEAVLATFHQWLSTKSETVVPGSLLGKAVGYALSQWPKLLRYLDAAYISPDTNAAERSIRPFVLGRKNWLMSGSPRGAEASCAIYSLIESAKQNGLNPYAYLHYLFTVAPRITDPDQWQQLLPASLDAAYINSAFLSTVR